MSAFGCLREYVASASFDENVVPPLRPATLRAHVVSPLIASPVRERR
jgi:hypothetical protein